MQFKYVTSMSRSMFDEYGEEMLKTFVQYWPRGELHVYVEEGTLPFSNDRVIYHQLYDVPGLQYFLDGVQHFPVFSGLIGGKIDYRYKIETFARKAFAQMAAAVDFSGYLFWVDADVTTQKHIPARMLEDWMRGEWMCVMKRDGWHLCSSFVGWDCAHAFAANWWPHYAKMYESGMVFLLDQWEDCTILESTIVSMPGVKNIAESYTGEGPYNVFDMVFEDYATHDKGPMKMQNRYGHLIQLVAETKPKRVLEIGTWNGGRAIEMAKVNPGMEYYGFDLFEEATDETDEIEKNVKPHFGFAEVTMRLRDENVSAKLAMGDSSLTLPRYLEHEGEETADLIFIDGGHSVETIRADLMNARRAIKPGGHIVMDDYYTDMPEDELREFGAQAVLNGGEYELFPTRDYVKGGGRVQMALVTA